MLAVPVHLEFGPAHWAAWQPTTVAGLLSQCTARWFVVGGWALELFRGSGWRSHEDLEIATPMWQFDAVRDCLSDYEFWVAGREGFWPVDEAGEAFFEYQQTMVRDPVDHLWRLDVLRIPDDGRHWICSADRRLVRAFKDAVAVTDDGVPYLRPQWVLLYKGLSLRDRDQVDFEATLPYLSTPAREELFLALTTTRGRSHPWITRLDSVS